MTGCVQVSTLGGCFIAVAGRLSRCRVQRFCIWGSGLGSRKNQAVHKKIYKIIKHMNHLEVRGRDCFYVS